MARDMEIFPYSVQYRRLWVRYPHRGDDADQRHPLLVFHRFDIHRGRRGYDDLGKTATEAILWLHCNLPPRPRGLFRSIASYSVTVNRQLYLTYSFPSSALSIDYRSFRRALVHILYIPLVSVS